MWINKSARKVDELKNPANLYHVIQAKNSAKWFYSSFEEQLNHSHPLYILANRIDWNVFEEAFKTLQCNPGQISQAYPLNGIVADFKAASQFK
ncbi:MAG: hypothetical protein IPJ81_09110 [Chitinophagaceae bacterium]|nr:hypothetical protein [Chitinophagaceae bacterium]